MRIYLLLNDGMGIRMKDFIIKEVHRKMMMEGGTKNQYIGGNCLKSGTWTVFRFEGGSAK